MKELKQRVERVQSLYKSEKRNYQRATEDLRQAERRGAQNAILIYKRMIAEEHKLKMIRWEKELQDLQRHA